MRNVGNHARKAIKGFDNIAEAEKAKLLLPPYDDQNKNRNSTNDDFQQNFELELRKGVNKKEYIISLFSRKLYAELYFAWCKDCSETITVENAKYFRDELLMRNNKDLKNFNFKSLRVGKNFLLAFIGNMEGGLITKLDLSDNLVSDVCMHNIKSIISFKKVVYLNLSSNMISTEGLKIIQNEVMSSDSLRYLNLGIVEGSFRRNNFTGEGGLILARILLTNESMNTFILQDNELGEESADKIGSALIQNKILANLKITDNKIRNRGAKSILENGDKLRSLDLSNNDITPEVCIDLKKLLNYSTSLQSLYWDSNMIGLKGIKSIIEGLNKSKSLKHLSLKNTSIGNAGVKILANGLRNNTVMLSLDLSSNAITYESFVFLCDALNTNSISTIKAKNNLLGDDSMQYFANTILKQDSKSSIVFFDFSSSKIYDQGLIYLLNELVDNKKITKIKLKDNYFSHEIDYVVIEFIEKNTALKHIDLTKNRFSFQCLQRIQKVVERNIKMENDKEPNKLLIEVYRLKYENTKLTEMKDNLKTLELNVDRIKLSRADIRQDYESFKLKCDEEGEVHRKLIEKNQYLLNQRNKEISAKAELVESTKNSNSENLEILKNKVSELQRKEKLLEEENEKIKNNTENYEREAIIKIEKINQTINKNKEKEAEYVALSKSLMDEIIKLDKIIKDKMKENK